MPSFARHSRRWRWLRPRLGPGIVVLAVVGGVFASAAVRAAPPPAPALQFTPSTAGVYDYGPITVGHSASQAFTLTNVGGASKTPLAISLSASAFTKTADGCTGTSLGPGKSCSVTVRYAPTAVGTDTGTLAAAGKKSGLGTSLSLTGTGEAAGHIYWTNSLGGIPGTGTIGRANLDGTGVNQSFVTGAAAPSGIVADSGHIYWANASDWYLSTYSTTIGRANLDGSSVNEAFITTGVESAGPPLCCLVGSQPYAVAVDSGHVYWAGSPDIVGRANLDGTGVDNGFITGFAPNSQLITGLAVDSGHIYWTDMFEGAIGRANLDGTGATNTFITGISGGPFGVVVDSGHIYWGDINNSAVGRANLDGTGVNYSFISGDGTQVLGVAVDAGHVYWGNSGSGTIGRANLDGTNVNQTFITGANQPRGIAISSS